MTRVRSVTQVGHDGALHPRRHRRDRAHREPPRPAVAVDIKVPEYCRPSSSRSLAGA